LIVVTRLLDLFAFLSVVLRGLTLSSQSLVIGGVAFLLLVTTPLTSLPGLKLSPAVRSCKRIIAWAAVTLALSRAAFLAVDSAILTSTADLGLADVVGANFFFAGSAAIAGALIIASICRSSSASVRPVMAVASVLILATSVATSHAASRVDYRAGLALLTGTHQLATATWIGGIPYLLLSLRSVTTDRAAVLISSRFSRVAFVSVILLALAGVAMSVFYVGSIESLYGTVYGVMVLAKVALFGMLLMLGAVNFSLVRRARTDARSLSRSLRRFAEVEVGIGFTVILAAASLTSQPPAADMAAFRVDSAQIVDRLVPRQWPQLKSPDLTELSPPTPLGESRARGSEAPPESYEPGSQPVPPNTPGDIAWSEYNHHWAGLVVLLMGLLAVGTQTGRLSWARNWPLLFLALAGFIFLRADPENWPLGPNGFWASFAVSDVLQHRAFVLMVVGLGVFEWTVQTGRIVSNRASRLFPLICAIGGALLLTHSHSLVTTKDALLLELSHVPLGLLGVLAGWSRWLDVGLPAKQSRFVSLIWPLCLVLSGVILLLYREG
jgi:putative copper resistance protein D